MKTEKDNKLLETLETGNELALDSLEQDIIANTKRDRLYALLSKQHPVVHLDQASLEKLRDIAAQQPAPGHNTGVGETNGAPPAEQPQQQEQPSPDAKTDTGANTGADNESDRSKFEKQITPLLKRLLKPVETSLDKAGKQFVSTVQGGAQSAAGEVQDMLQLDQLPFFSTIKDTIKGVSSSALTAGKSLFERKKHSPDDKIAAILEKLSAPVQVPAPLTAGGDGSLFKRNKPDDVNQKAEKEKKGVFDRIFKDGSKASEKRQAAMAKSLEKIQESVGDIELMMKIQALMKAMPFLALLAPMLKFIIPIAAGIGALVGLVVKYWEPIKSFISGVYDVVKNTISTAVESFTKMWEWFSSGKFVDDISKAFSEFFKKFSDPETYTKAASDIADKGVEYIADKVDQGRQILNDVTAGKSENILAGISNTSKFVREKADQGRDWLQQKTGIDLSDQANAERLETVKAKAGDVGSQIWNGLTNMFNSTTTTTNQPVNTSNKPSGSRAIEHFSAGRESDDDAVAIAQQAAEFRAEKHQLEQQQQMMAGAAKMVANTVVTNNNNTTNLLPSQTRWPSGPDHDVHRYGAVR